MSCCTFIIIEHGKAYFNVNHYSAISNILKSNNPRGYRNSTELNIYDAEQSDTSFNPSIIIDFDHKVLTNTSYNWFDNFKKYLPKGWTYKTFEVELCKQCGYMLCKNKDNCGAVKQ